MNTHVRTSFANLSARAPPRPHLTCGGSSASEPPLSCFEPGRRRRDKKVQKERDGEHTKCPSRQRCGAGLVRARTWPNEHRHRLPLPRHLPLVIIVARPGAVTALSPILVARKRGARCDALCSDAGTRREEPDALKTLGDAMMHGSLWAILSCGCVQAPTPNPKPQTPTRARTRDAAHSFESAPAEALARALSVLSPCRLAKPKSRSSTASATTARVLW